MSFDGRSIENAILETVTELQRTSAMETIAKFIELLDTVRNNIDLQFYTRKVLVDSVWTPIRENDSLMRLVMNGTSKFNSLLAMDSFDNDKVIQILVSSLLCFDDLSDIVDAEARAKRASSPELNKLFDSNKWLVFLVYCGMSLGKINEQLLTSLRPTPQTVTV